MEGDLTKYCVKVSELNFQRGRHSILEGINLSIPKGIIYGIIGPNGAGKTTLLKCLAGLLNPTNGRIVLCSRSWEKDRKALAAIVGVIIEAPALYEHLSIKENLTINSEIFSCSNERIEDVIEITGIGKFTNKRVKELSTGNKQRLGWAIALLHDPEILILDEPFNGLDPIGFRELESLLLKLKAINKTIIITSHLLLEMERLCDHLALLNNGQVLYAGDIGRTKSHQVVTFFGQHIGIAEELPTLLGNQFILNKNNDSYKLTVSGKEDIQKIFVLHAKGEIQIEGIKQDASALESFFMEVIQRKR